MPADLSETLVSALFFILVLFLTREIDPQNLPDYQV
jgi:hypothetical protein